MIRPTTMRAAQIAYDNESEPEDGAHRCYTCHGDGCEECDGLGGIDSEGDPIRIDAWGQPVYEGEEG